MTHKKTFFKVVLFSCLWPLTAIAADDDQATLCVLVMDAQSAKILKEQGSCDQRTTPASTFKVPLAVMGFDSAYLKNSNAPVLHYQKGEPDWGGTHWTGDVTPESWIKYSVVWYSQRMAKALGAQKLHDYATAFHYGNADFSGDAGHNNGLERAWIASSLKVSPREQVEFIRKLLLQHLPVTKEAQKKAAALVQKGGETNGWTIYGKTGMAYPRKADYTFDEDHPYGWYVGWAIKDKRRVVFAVLRQDKMRMKGSASQRARESLMDVFSGKKW